MGISYIGLSLNYVYVETFFIEVFIVVYKSLTQQFFI